MFCGNCGVENVNGAKFCKGCGKPLGNSNQGVNIIPSQNNLEGNVTAALPKTDKIKAVPKKVLIGVCAAVIVLVIIICAAVNSSKTINLNKFLTVEATGYDGFGTAKVAVDWDAVEKKYGSRLSFKSTARNEYGGFLGMMTPVEVIQGSVKVKPAENGNLSNGTTVAYTWEVDEDYSKYVKCKVKYKDDSFTVSGLTEVGTFDAFADLNVEFSGIAPNGNANLNYIGSELNYYDFDCDRRNGLSNGDTVTVTIDDSRLEYYAENLGKIPEVLEKEYKVDGLDSYLAKISEIDDEALAAMQQQATDVYYAHIAQNWGEGESLASLTYIGNYLLTAKNKDSWGNNNIVYLVYKAQVKNDYSNDGKSYNKLNDVYWYISFNDLMVGADGKVIVDVTYYNTPNDRFTIDSGVSSGWFGTKTWRYYGYQTLDDLYKAVVAYYMDSYNHEDNVDESIAPETVVEEEPETDETGFIFPDSDTELLTMADLEGLSAQECKIARNEIYARHGRKFQDEELQAHFKACDWYEGTIDPDDFKETDLTDTEIANKDLIVAYEEEQGYR